MNPEDDGEADGETLGCLAVIVCCIVVLSAIIAVSI